LAVSAFTLVNWPQMEALVSFQTYWPDFDLRLIEKPPTIRAEMLESVILIMLRPCT